MTKPKSTEPTPPPNDDDVGEFAAFKTNDALAAFLFVKYGEEAVRAVFRTDTYARENLEDYAEELEARGLDQVAAIMRDIASQCESGLTLDNPFTEGETYIGPDGREWPNLNWSEWRRFWILRRRERTGELSAFLRRHHARKQREIQASKAKPSHTRH